MIDTTLCFLRKPGKILLAMKKRGFGTGKWNGFGGKLLPGETIEQAMVREASEEVSVTIDPTKLQKVADLYFTFVTKPEWSQHVHVFFVDEWQGEPVESEEMKPEWYEEDELPFKEMWVDDEHWLPRVIAGEKLEGHFLFDDNGQFAGPFEVKRVG